MTIIKKVFILVWNLPRIIKIAGFILIILIIPYFLNILLFYTRYALPKDGFVPDENVIFTFREGDKVYKGHFDGNGVLQKEFVEIDNSINTGEKDYAEELTKNEYNDSNVRMIQKRNRIYDLFGLCTKVDFLFKYPCYGMTEYSIILVYPENMSLISMGTFWFFETDFKKSAFLAVGTASTKGDIVSVFIQKTDTPNARSGNDYIYLYSISKHSWKKLLETKTKYGYVGSDIELLKIED